MLQSQQVAEIITKYREDPLKMLQLCGGFYECPRDANGKRVGPLVGYAGRYDDGKKQFVGDVYANFAMAEQYPAVLRQMALDLQGKLRAAGAEIDVFCGAPMGGIAFAGMLGLVCNCAFAYTEKKVIALATDSAREQSEMIFKRHTIGKEARVVLIEDVCNNFSTTDAMIALIQRAGGQVVAVACLLNRSVKFENEYTPASGPSIPIFSLVRKIIEQYKQDDSKVVDDVVCGNVAWKPKDRWSELMEAMDQAVA
jgi:orotate phosphoribosyltransferase